MNFKIHNLKLESSNNSCKSVSTTQLQHYTSSPIHLKNNAKQNKDKNNNNNEHKRGTTKGGKSTYLWVRQFDCCKLKGKYAIVDPQQHFDIHPQSSQ